jgi:hypothetical protein
VLRMRRYLFIISVVLLVVSALLTVLTLTTPSQKVKKVPLVKYTQTGRFDYAVTLKPSYLFGPEPQKTTVPLANPKYQADQVDRFLFSFNYNLNVQPPVAILGARAEVTATGQNKDGKPAQVTLYPATQLAGPGPYAVDFVLVPGDLAFNGDMTVTIDVIPTLKTGSGIVFDSFSQVLVVHDKNNVYEIERSGLEQSRTSNLGDLSLVQTGQLTYSVQLKASSSLGAVTVAPPVADDPTPAQVAAPVTNPATVFSKLVDTMDMSFKYNFASDAAVRDLTESVTVTALLENTDVWNKTLVLASSANQTGDFELSFPVDMPRIMQTLDNIRSELGISSGDFKLTIQADVRVTGLTDVGPITDTFSPSLSTSLDKGVIQWAEDLTQSKTGSLDREMAVTNTGIFGMNIDTARIVVVALLAVFLLACLYFGWLVFTLPQNKRSAVDVERRKIMKKYGNRIVGTASSPKGWSTVNVISMEDLIKISDELGKPVTAYSTDTPEEKHVFSVLDGSNCYQYVLEDSSSIKLPEIKAKA